MPNEVEKLKNQLTQKKLAKDTLSGDFLSSGATLVNLALTGKPTKGLAKGCYYLWVGDSASGKTFLALTALAEATLNKAFDNYRLIYYGPERGDRMDLQTFFGVQLAERLEHRYPTTVEEFYYDLDDAIKEGPVMAVLDSMDALTSEDEQKTFSKRKKAAEKQEKAVGSWGLSKPKVNSSNIRVVNNHLSKHGSILIVISQTRHNIGFGAQFNPKTRSGGDALRFYATGELWFSVKGPIKKTALGKARKIGSVLQVKVKKNRDTGREPVIELHHYVQKGIGIDDVGSNVAFLVGEGHWTDTKGKLTAPEFDFEGSRENLIQQIQEKNQERQLRQVAADLWAKIEAACAVNRKRRYK